MSKAIQSYILCLGSEMQECRALAPAGLAKTGEDPTNVGIVVETQPKEGGKRGQHRKGFVDQQRPLFRPPAMARTRSVSGSSAIAALKRAASDRQRPRRVLTLGSTSGDTRSVHRSKPLGCGLSPKTRVRQPHQLDGFFDKPILTAAQIGRAEDFPCVVVWLGGVHAGLSAA